jgi:hypothetical protein
MTDEVKTSNSEHNVYVRHAESIPCNCLGYELILAIFMNMCMSYILITHLF